MLAACGVPSERAEETQIAETKEKSKEWPEEHDSCEVQEFSGYLYEHTSVSPYASAEITIKDYEGERLETDWDEPSAFQFAGEADVTWRFYNSLAEMETALNEAVMQDLVFKLSCFGRNATDVSNFLQIMQDYGVNLICVEDGIDAAQI